MIHMPAELQRLIPETDRLAEEIRILKRKGCLSLTDLRRLACHKARLLQMCPPERYVWVDGVPVADILKTLSEHQTEREMKR